MMSEFDSERVKRVLSLARLEVKPPKDPHCQPHTLLKQIASESRTGIYQESENAEVSQWLSLSRGLLTGAEKKSNLLTLLDTSLADSSYLLPTSVAFGLADLAVFDAIQQPKVDSECNTYRNICRWARQMSDVLSVPLPWNLTFEPTVFGVVSTAVSSSSGDGKAVTKSSTEEKKEQPEVKKEIPPMSAKQIAKQKEKAAKKEKAKKETPETTEQNAAGDDLDPSKLDFRVGRILKCWPHPKAEKLLCEEIDMGNGEVRQIASGIKEHYTPEEVQGRNVIVLCNLKDRTMLEFKSQGMVICASNADHSVVKLLEPPATAQPGDCVSFPGFGLEEELADGGKRREPATSSQVAKKKILEKLAPGLKTNENGIAMWENSPFTIGSLGTVGSPLPNALVG
jgi:methionine--tRNA ligase beta chain